VIAGAWNPAIFSLEWIATNILGKKENDILNVTHVISNTGDSIIYFDEIGISAHTDRLSLYCNNIDQISAFEDVCITILRLLSHTPVSGIGVNFIFCEEKCEAAIIDKVQTKEKLNQYKKIISQQIKTALEIQPMVTLNLERLLSSGDMTFNFNYHHVVINTTSAIEQVNGSIEKCREDALALLRDVYELTDAESIRHCFQS
jgi:hypothetical protein